MTKTTLRHSPIHHRFDSDAIDWSVVADMPIARKFHGEEKNAAIERVGLCDLSGLTKLGVKGRDAESWLIKENVELPAANYESRRFADGGILVRLAADEFLLESGLVNQSVPELSAKLKSANGQVFRVERQEATFLLVGSSAPAVLAQTCGVDFSKEADQCLVLTRVAGASCGVFLDDVNKVRAYRFWIDYSYAEYLWEMLQTICEDLGGRVMGAGRVMGGMP